MRTRVPVIHTYATRRQTDKDIAGLSREENDLDSGSI